MNNQTKKTILYLINGLGIATKDSFDIKFNEMMPNLSMLMGNYMYQTLENINYNYNNGFRNFSLGNNLLPTYKKLEEDSSFEQNPKVINIATDANHNHTKVQLFCFLDHEQVINQIVKIVNVLRPKGTFPICIHIVLRQKDVQDYDLIIKMIKQLEDKITLFNNVEIGTVVGERKVNTNDYFHILSKEIGERWPDYERKLNYLKTTQEAPRQSDGFYMNRGFILQPNDISLFLNYEEVDCNGLINKLEHIKLYTLFPMKEYSYAVNIYEEIPPNEYFSKTLEQHQLKCLILTKKERQKNIIYNLCGLNEEKSNNIDFLEIDQKIDLDSLLKKDYQYIIFDYDISIFKEISQIKDFLMELDEQINEIYKLCDQSENNLIVSSLYGMYREYIIGVDKQVKLDYSKEVPVVFIDNDFPASQYSLKYGNTHDLSNTIFYAILKDENIPKLFRKKGLFSFFKD